MEFDWVLSDVPESKEYIQGGTVVFHGASGRGTGVSPVEDHAAAENGMSLWEETGTDKREFDCHLHKFGTTNCQLEIATPWNTQIQQKTLSKVCSWIIHQHHAKLLVQELQCMGSNAQEAIWAMLLCQNHTFDWKVMSFSLSHCHSQCPVYMPPLQNPTWFLPCLPWSMIKMYYYRDQQ